MKTILVTVIAGVAIVFYVLGVWSAGKYSRAGQAERMPTFLLHAITTIGPILAVNLGAFLGIEVGEALRLRSLPLSEASIGTWMRGIGALVYFLSLIWALYFWWKTEWENDPKKIVRTVPEHSRMLLGVLVGALVVVFAFD